MDITVDGMDLGGSFEYEITSWQGDVTRTVVDESGTELHPRMWDRLNSIYGEVNAVGRALELNRYNAVQRRIPLTGEDAP